MRRILLILCLVTLSHAGYSQTQPALKNNKVIVGEFIEGCRNIKDIKIVEIGSAMTQMLAAKLTEGGNNSNATLLRSIESITIIVDIGSDVQLRKEMFELPKQCVDYKLLSSISEKGDSSVFYFASHEGTKICEFMMIVKRDAKNIMLYMVGEFSIKDISALSELSEGISTKR